MRIRALFGLVLLASAGTTAAAQSTRYLQSSRWELGVGEAYSLGFHGWQAGAASAAPWPEHFDWFFVRSGGRQTNLADPRANPRSKPAESRELELTATHAGITLLAADRPPFVEELATSEFLVFLAEHVGRSTLPEGYPTLLDAATLRVRRIESSKALIRVLGQEGFLPNSATAQSKSGQRVEIRPLADPTSVPVKSDLPLRIYVPNPRKSGTLVIARHLASGRTQSFRTDAMGTGFFTITVSGVWMIEAHHARPVEPPAKRLGPPEEADWELFSATLCFEVPPGDPRQGGAR